MAKANKKQKQKNKAASAAVSNAALVEAFRNYDRAKDEAKSYLVEIGEITQNEQLSRAEVIASMMEARGVEKSTAESQYSRMLKILNDPETLEDLKSGKIDLATARQKTTKKQKAPSSKKKAENLEKRYSKILNQLVEVAKEGGYDRASVVSSVSATLKKAGVK